MDKILSSNLTVALMGLRGQHLALHSYQTFIQKLKSDLPDGIAVLIEDTTQLIFCAANEKLLTERLGQLLDESPLLRQSHYTITSPVSNVSAWAVKRSLPSLTANEMYDHLQWHQTFRHFNPPNKPIGQLRANWRCGGLGFDAARFALIAAGADLEAAGLTAVAFNLMPGPVDYHIEVAVEDWREQHAPYLPPSK